MEGQRRGRVRPSRTVVIAVWGVATLLGLALAATTRIGPVLLSLSARHGVHLGDLLGFALAYAAALAITLRRP